MYQVLLMFVEGGGFYPIEGVYEMPLEKEAAKIGEANDHIVRIEDMDRNVLWERTKQ